jgi:Flp pilus assembly pilin Flp
VRRKVIQFHAWLTVRAAQARHDDRGSVLSEYGILLGVMAVAALAGATYVATNVEGWFDSLPVPGG